jgi:hypothetical protein
VWTITVLRTKDFTLLNRRHRSHSFERVFKRSDRRLFVVPNESASSTRWSCLLSHPRLFSLGYGPSSLENDDNDDHRPQQDLPRRRLTCEDRLARKLKNDISRKHDSVHPPPEVVAVRFSTSATSRVFQPGAHLVHPSFVALPVTAFTSRRRRDRRRRPLRKQLGGRPAQTSPAETIGRQTGADVPCGNNWAADRRRRPLRKELGGRPAQTHPASHLTGGGTGRRRRSLRKHLDGRPAQTSPAETIGRQTGADVPCGNNWAADRRRHPLRRRVRRARRMRTRRLNSVTSS